MYSPAHSKPLTYGIGNQKLHSFSYCTTSLSWLRLCIDVIDSFGPRGTRMLYARLNMRVVLPCFDVGLIVPLYI